MTREEHETKGFMLGQISGIGAAAQFVDNLAVEFYKDRLEEAAKHYRKVADKIFEYAKSEREKYDKEYHPKVEGKK